MEGRYRTLVDHGKEHVGELAGPAAVPRWVVVFDEFADLMADRADKRDMERHLKRLGAKARAAGIHLVLGTQRPEATVVTPLLRANLPGRISLQVPTERDSKIILDEPDAAHLLDKGDLLWRDRGGLTRLQSPFLTREELEGFLRAH
jgi:S-DNA-T family DNA segregation ATPase FtsK/SpoIIIE